MVTANPQQQMVNRMQGVQGAQQAGQRAMMPNQQRAVPQQQQYKYPQQYNVRNPQQQQYAGATGQLPGQDQLTTSMLAHALPQEQKQMLGERIFPLVKAMYPEEAGKVTGMLLEMDNSELLMMMDDNALLQSKVAEAVQVLRANKEAAKQ